MHWIVTILASVAIVKGPKPSPVQTQQQRKEQRQKARREKESAVHFSFANNDVVNNNNVNEFVNNNG
ncbi:hypothetical protein NECAME_06060 [Necator americanus]|uniref:Uncharacterized protein n=1 Tax=Necator americanus TaxID=51031 RepID=W2TYI3_NECAM|nr:hypothetical protein NECAME_06060 [Necator americanus]ETN86087.1 hypothetical protein NECAME_06060 [Necator americanus]